MNEVFGARLLGLKSYRSLVLHVQLESAGRTHFISSVEQTCAEIHREIVLRGVDVELRAGASGSGCELHMRERPIPITLSVGPNFSKSKISYKVRMHE